ncbi:MAG: hypothetical protein M3Z03_17060, partial [Actinomycetota bacterium]|nr:hypothetical protein [Actinomycetota bacterium]
MSLRRGLPTVITEIGKVTQEAIDRVRLETEPCPTTPDELHDLLSALVLSPCPTEWSELLSALSSRGRVASLTGDDGTQLWHTVEAATVVQAVVTGVDAPECTAEAAAAAVLRGHLEVASPITAAALATR